MNITQTLQGTECKENKSINIKKSRKEAPAAGGQIRWVSCLMDSRAQMAPKVTLTRHQQLRRFKNYLFRPRRGGGNSKAGT